MQAQDQSKVSTLRRTERMRTARTPDRSDIRNMDFSTMSLGSPKRSVHMSRVSMINPSTNTTSTNLRKMELENNNLELELTYSEYVRSYAEMYLEKKILKDTEVSYNNSMKKAQKETQSLMENCKLIETRVIDIKVLSLLNDYVDSVQSIIHQFKEKEEEHKTQNILKQLRELLDRFSVLRCENIILPKSQEEMEQFKKTLNGCSTLLTEVNEILRCDELENVTADYREFLLMCKEISSVKKIVEEKFCALQLKALKSCSNILAQNEEDCDSKEISQNEENCDPNEICDS